MEQTAVAQNETTGNSANPPTDKIDDVGEIIPYARKHLARSRDKNDSTEISLKTLWPEPDWKEKVEIGMPVEVASILAMTYNGLSTKPRPGDYYVTQEDWESAYIQAIKILRELMEDTYTLEKAKKINARLAQRLGYDSTTIVKHTIHESRVYWAAGRGNGRTYKPPAKLTTRLALLAHWLPKLGWPENDACIKSSLVPCETVESGWRVSRIEGNTLQFLPGIHETEDEAIAATIEQAEKEKQCTHLPKKPIAKAMSERIGTDHRGEREITADELMQEYGLRAIQFGESLSQKERQWWVNASYDALADLADIMEMPRRWISLGKVLALALGARGKGKAMAHYEPTLNVINLTREKGAGSLAHEWAHALDARLVKTIYPPEEYGTVREYVTPFIHFMHLHLAENHKEIGQRLHEIRSYSLPPWLGSGSDFLRQAHRIESKRRAGTYWTKPEEMFARGFEAYIQDALLEKGWVNPVLVNGTLETDYECDHFPQKRKQPHEKHRKTQIWDRTSCGRADPLHSAYGSMGQSRRGERERRRPARINYSADYLSLLRNHRVFGCEGQ